MTQVTNTQVTNIDHEYQANDNTGRLETRKLRRIRQKQKRHSLVYTIAAGVGALVVFVAGVGIYATHKDVTIKYGDATAAVSTWQKTPAAVLAQENIELASDTRISQPDRTLSDGDTIELEKAKTVTVEKDGKMKQIQTYATSAEEVMKENPGVAAVAIAGSDTGNLPIVTSDKTVEVKIGGTSKKVLLNKDTSVRDAIEAAGIKTSPLDRVIAAGAPLSKKGTAKAVEVTSVKIQRVERVVNEDKSVIKAPVDKQKDSSMYKGQTEVVEEGRDGLRVKRTFVEKVDGKEVYSRQLEDKVVKAPQTRVVKVGTKDVPAAASSGGATYAGEGVWGALARCESGGNPRSVSSGGHYHGLYQFSPSTWRSVGGTGLPSQASPEEQTKRAKMLQARSGWGQWPACSRSIGVR